MIKNHVHSQAWHTHRTGKITSTTLYRVYTVVTESAKTNLVKQVMHDNKQELSHVPAVLWGKDMEDTARKQYTEITKAQHHNFDVELCGVVVQPDKPHLRASPDGIANCTCCGKATVEIKCCKQSCLKLKCSSNRIVMVGTSLPRRCESARDDDVGRRK